MNPKLAAIGVAALGGVALASGSASAMPNGLPHTAQIAGQSTHIDQVRWVCNPWGRCWWRPNYYGYGYYGYRPYRYGYGYAYGHRPYWRRW